MAAITELNSFGEALVAEAAGPGVTFKIATEIKNGIQWRACDDFGLAAENTPHTGKSHCDFRSPISMHIGHIERTPNNMAELRDSKCAEYWTRAMKRELESHAEIETFSDESIPQQVNVISAMWCFRVKHRQ